MKIQRTTNKLTWQFLGGSRWKKKKKKNGSKRLSGSLLSYSAEIEVDLWSEMKEKKTCLGRTLPLCQRGFSFSFPASQSQLELSWFTPLNISAAAVTQFIRSCWFCTRHLSAYLALSILRALAAYCLRGALAKCSDLWPADVSFRRKSEVMLSFGLFSLMTERLMLHNSQCTMTTYNVLFEVSDLHINRAVL